MFNRFRKIDKFNRHDALRYAQSVQSSKEYTRMYVEQLVIKINEMIVTINHIIDYINNEQYNQRENKKAYR